MVEFPEAIEFNTTTWHLRNLEGRPIYVCHGHDRPRRLDDMEKTLEISGHSFRPVFRSDIGLHYAFELPAPQKFAHDLLISFQRVQLAFRTEKHICKLLAEERDDDEIHSLLESLKMIRRECQLQLAQIRFLRAQLVGHYDHLFAQLSAEDDDKRVALRDRAFQILAEAGCGAVAL